MLIILAFTFTTLPADFAGLLSHSINTTRIPEELLGGIAKKLLGGQDSKELRLELIDQIEASLQSLEKELVTAAKKSSSGTMLSSKKESVKTPEKIIRETEDLLEELRSRNADEGFLRETAEKIISKMLPSSKVCECASGK